MGLARRSLQPWPARAAARRFSRPQFAENELRGIQSAQARPWPARAAARRFFRPQFAENELRGIQSAQARGEKAGAEAFQARAHENDGGVADDASPEEQPRARTPSSNHDNQGCGDNVVMLNCDWVSRDVEL